MYTLCHKPEQVSANMNVKNNRLNKRFILSTVYLLIMWMTALYSQSRFSFTIAGDFRQHTYPQYTSRDYFAGACEAIADIKVGDFMILTGDIDPPKNAIETVKTFFGKELPVYAVVGNHDIPGSSIESYPGENIEFLRSYNQGGNTLPNIIRSGPGGCEETTYAFDYKNAHFVILNVYYDGQSDHGINGDISDSLYLWLENDLAQTDKQHIFVIGHEPAFFHPDYDKGYFPIIDDNTPLSSGNDLSKYPYHRNRFWDLLVQYEVTAYFCGHYHSFSAYRHRGVWQIACGHARGIVEHFRSTFIKINVDQDSVEYQAFRDNHNGWPYSLAYSGTLDSRVTNYSIKGYAWNDNDGDGERADIEVSMPDIRILLTTSAGNTISHVISDDNGMFTFDSLAPGRYHLAVDYSTLEDDFICSTANLPMQIEIVKNELNPVLEFGFKRTWNSSFTVALTSDMRMFSGQGAYDTPLYFRGVCEAIRDLKKTAFMITPGDEDPPSFVRWTLDKYLGESYLWYPAVGNHELPAETFEFYPEMNMDYLRQYNRNGNSLPYIVNTGPPGCEETTYSFDYKNAHFAVINEYYDGSSDMGTDGDVIDPLYHWLKADLGASDKPFKFVIGHEPAFPQPDADNGLLRHVNVCLDKYPQNRDRFWNLLVEEEVVAYLTAHTHCYSLYNHRGVWQMDCGHARGLTPKKNVKSTFILMTISENQVSYQTYRDNYDGGPYHLTYSGVLASTEPSGNIGNLVWHDKDGNNIQSEDEKGLPGIKLVLLNAFGDTVAQSRTNQKGYYLLENIPADSYWLYIAENSLSDDIANPDAEHLMHQLTLIGNEDYLEADFGLAKKTDFVQKITYTFERTGWNLISLPGKTDDMRVISIFPNANPKLTLTFEQNEYVAADTLETGKAYWLFIERPAQVTVELEPAESIHRQFNLVGWHLLGSPIHKSNLSDSIFPANSIHPIIMSYDNTIGQIEPSNELEPTKGYWILVRKACDLVIQNNK
ncbi:hypothetical protein GF407_12600 [candidate division KSB1 bacterium]|nr:hypothetical protein [candidate division KSB1 bacterium]